MELSEVRVKLINDPGDRLKAVCTITFDDVFVVRDVKVVDGTNGLFVAMPSRKLSVHCPECKYKNHLRAKYCNECGAELPPYRTSPDANGRSRLHRDLAHPITVEFREELQRRVIAAFQMELERAKDPNYEPAGALDEEEEEAEIQTEPARPMSEYDAMIAELKADAARGRGEEPRRQEGRSGPRDEAPPARGPRRDSRDTRDSGRPPREASGPRRQAENQPSSQPPRPRESQGDGRRPPPPPRSPGPEPRRSEAPPKRETPAPRPVEEPRPVVRKPAPAPATVTTPAQPEGDDTGFGAGIL